MTLKSCLVLFSIKPMITLTNLRKKQQNGYRGAGFGRGQASELFGRSPRHRKMVPAHRGRASRHREMVPAHRRRASRRREDLPNSSETLRDDARTFRTLRKRFAASRNGSRTPRKGFPSELPLPFGHLPLQKGEKN